jgi:hypothetical protein
VPTLRNEKCQEVALVIVVPIGIAIAFASRVSGIGTFLTSAQHLRGWEERRQAIAQAAEKAGRIRDLLARNGIDCRLSPGAGTGLRVRIGERRLVGLDPGPACFGRADKFSAAEG